MQRLFTDAVLLEFIAKILVGFFETLAIAAAITDPITHPEGQDWGQKKPQRDELLLLRRSCLLLRGCGVLAEHTADSGAGDTVHLGDLAHAHSVLAVSADGFAVQFEWSASDVTAF